MYLSSKGGSECKNFKKLTTEIMLFTLWFRRGVITWSVVSGHIIINASCHKPDSTSPTKKEVRKWRCRGQWDRNNPIWTVIPDGSRGGQQIHVHTVHIHFTFTGCFIINDYIWEVDRFLSCFILCVHRWCTSWHPRSKFSEIVEKLCTLQQPVWNVFTG